MKILVTICSVLLMSQLVMASTKKFVEGSNTYNGPVLSVINENRTDEEWKKSYKIVEYLAKEETQRQCVDNEKGKIVPDSYVCVSQCRFEPFGRDFFTAQIVCNSTCKAECEVN